MGSMFGLISSLSNPCYHTAMRILVFLVSVLLFSTVPHGAQADYFVWQDPDSGMTVTFPDTWNILSNRKPDDTLVIAGDSLEDKPLNEDRRFVIYPPKLGKAIQETAISTGFWDSYLSRYVDFNLSKVFDGAGLGRWFASYAQGTFIRMNGTQEEIRTGLMFASLYNDKAYVLECSTLTGAYAQWDLVFRSILKSINFEKMYHELPTGHYRNFLKGANRYFWAGGPEGTVGY